MTVSLKHQFQSSNPDGPDSSQVQPSNWNAEHALLCATARILGRTTAGTGAVEELTAGTGITLSAGSISITPGTYATITGTETLTNKTLTSPTISSPTITGGSISGITDLAIADGGTGASTAAAALANLGFTSGGTSTKGYVDIPIGATVLRINYGTTTVSSDTSTTDTFSAAFSTLFVGGVIGWNDTNTSHTDNVSGYAMNTTTISLTNGQPSSLNLQWLAIGLA